MYTIFSTLANLNEIGCSIKHGGHGDMTEHRYRTGFYHGVIAAVRLMRLFHNQGFSRTTEILNELDIWIEELRAWRYAALTGEPALMPKPKAEAWRDIRKRIIKRDRHCTECGASTKLHVHHIVSVQDGGLSVDWNLTTLCRSCHGRTHR